MTDPASFRHSVWPMRFSAQASSRTEGAAAWEAVAALYDEHFEALWRNLRRLGVPEKSLDDAVQDVLLIAHRRLKTFEGRSSLKTWLLGIGVRVSSDYRRQARRSADPLSASVPDAARDPQKTAEDRQALALVQAALLQLDDAKRAVLVLMDLEQMSAPEVAEALKLKLNTVYSRLRVARSEFEAALERLGAYK